MTDAPNYELKSDRSHACAVPWVDVAAYQEPHWQCRECGRWWHRTWELTSDQPPADDELLLRRAGIAPGGETEVVRQRVVIGSGTGLDYLIWVPEERPRRTGWPLIVFLHGGGQSGGHASNAVRGGLPHEIEQGLTLPYVVLSPHCPVPPHPNRQNWLEFPAELEATIAQVCAQYPIDESAILLTGLSMGGFGTWHLGARMRFSALAPVCGGGDPRQALSLARTPICVFHGVHDSIVPIERASEMIKAVRAHGGQVEAVIYPDAAHSDTAQRAYSPESRLYDWFAATITPSAVR